MAYRLRDGLSFCRVEGKLIFLDIQSDRYFRLSNALEEAFVAHMAGEWNANVDIGGLIERNILTNAAVDDGRVCPVVIAGPTRSALEPPPPPRHLRAAPLLEVFAIVCATWLQVRTCRLKSVLDTLTSYRRKRVLSGSAATTDWTDERLSHALSTFRQARLCVPIETCCLLDSISMIRFLAKRRIYANIVFGVMGAPFSAHCWVQVDSLVLNDTIGNVYSHTPIRVI